jgi:hypothetical protein
MKMQVEQLSKFSFEVQTKNLPVNIYAIRILDTDKNQIHDVCISHNGYCPNISTEREQSNFNDYLSNLEYGVINELKKKINIKNNILLYELMTDNNGNLYFASKRVLDK